LGGSAEIAGSPVASVHSASFSQESPAKPVAPAVAKPSNDSPKSNDDDKDEESLSIEESSGEGDLDLAAGKSIPPSSGISAAQRTPASFPSSGAMQTVGPEDEVEEDISIEEEDIDNSHESYQSSEAALSTGAQSRGEDAGF